MSDLFQIPESRSPRLLWMEANDIHTSKTAHLQADEEPWNAWTGDLMEALSQDAATTGDTEDEAIVELAKRLGLGLWNGA